MSRAFLSTTLLAGAIGLTSCGGSEVAAGGRTLPNGPARRVILVSCDTLRADHLGCYGYDRPTSPRIDELASESILFTSAWSAASCTMPAVSSLLAGRFPDEIGATPSNEDLMPASVVTLAELVRATGLDTTAFVANSVLCRAAASQGEIGVQQGFAHFDDEMTAGPGTHAAPERASAETTDAVLKWLDARGSDDRFFLWVHYMDPHGPYTPSPEHLAPFHRDPGAEADLPVSSEHGATGVIPTYQVVGDERKPGQYVDRYDGEIHQVDFEIGRLLDALRSKGWLDDALVVFTADHGESLGEGDHWFSHSHSLQRELVHVPLIVRPPQAMRAELIPDGMGRRNGKLAMHLDVFPTVLAALGIEAPKRRGTSLLQSHLPDGRVAAHFFGRSDQPRRWIGVTDGRWHMITIGPRIPHLFDLIADPGETTDVAAGNPTILTRLEARYAELMAADSRERVEGARRAVDERVRRNMGALGYTGDTDH